MSDTTNTGFSVLGVKPLLLDKEEEKGKSFPITITPEGTAGLFLQHHCQTASRGDQVVLAQLLIEYWRGGYDAAKTGKPRA